MRRCVRFFLCVVCCEPAKHNVEMNPSVDCFAVKDMYSRMLYTAVEAIHHACSVLSMLLLRKCWNALQNAVELGLRTDLCFVSSATRQVGRDAENLSDKKPVVLVFRMSFDVQHTSPLFGTTAGPDATHPYMHKNPNQGVANAHTHVRLLCIPRCRWARC